MKITAYNSIKSKYHCWSMTAVELRNIYSNYFTSAFFVVMKPCAERPDLFN